MNKNIAKMVYFLCWMFFLTVVVLVTPGLLASSLVAVVGYYFLTPFVEGLKFLPLSHSIRVRIIYFGIGLLIVLVTAIFWPSVEKQSREFVTLLPHLSKTVVASLQYHFREWANWFPEIWLTHFWEEIQPSIVHLTTQWGRALPSVMGQSLVFIFLSSILTYVFLSQSQDWKDLLLAEVPEYWRLRFNELFDDLKFQLGGFIRARFLESLAVFFLTWGSLEFIGLPFSLLLGFVAGLFNIVPYVGPLAAAAIAVLVCFTTQEPLWNSTLTLIAFAVIQFLDAFVYVPFFMSRIVNLHPVWVIVAVLLGAKWLGIVGMVISIPIACSLKVASKHLRKWIEESDS